MAQGRVCGRTGSGIIGQPGGRLQLHTPQDDGMTGDLEAEEGARLQPPRSALMRTMRPRQWLVQGLTGGPWVRSPCPCRDQSGHRDQQEALAILLVTRTAEAMALGMGEERTE